MERQGILVLLLCNYYVTYRCNAFCEFCHFADHGEFKNTPHADLQDFKTNVNQLAKLGVKFIDLTGGEPLLNPDIHLMADHARKLKMQTSITSNALLYPKFADKLAGKINLLHFSLDSPDEEEHNTIRKVNCFNHVFDSINIAKSLGEYPDILFTVTNDTYKKLPRMYDIAIEKDLILIVNPVFSYFGNPGLNEEALDFIEEYIEGKPNIYLNNAFIKLRRNGGNNINNPTCKAVSRVIVISPYNEIILPCYHFGNKKILIDRPINEIRESEEVRQIKSMEGKYDFCDGCTVNCYFEPSFAFPTNMYGIMSLTSKFKYSFNKLVKQQFKKRL
ncbi:MAG: radical SAM protein [Melioribacteraceae bacterium]|nr:radical SAM protein [Melioribacteraceae bacterium]MCF8354636.1 radical SAM protein [Melioribacteraceae bacterium]MCF8395024.1 radical SAM protein [Melioribacteraceae bacterium]MCF8418872.1 radical SAM protein [Melioribacteraceae bacterium]